MRLKIALRIFLFAVGALFLFPQCARTASGSTLLHWAAYNGYDDVAARILTTAKTDINAMDNNGDTPLAVAVKGNQQKIVELLIANGADIVKKDRAGMTPLHRASEKGSGGIAKALLKDATIGPALAKMKDAAGNEPIVYAFRGGFGAIMLDLLRKGSPYTVKNEAGQTLVHWAAREGDLELLKYLLAIDLDINLKDNNGYVALHLAADQGHKDAVMLLLERGADPNIPWPASRLF